MRITHLKANNIKGFDSFDVDCGDVNIVAGKNATGKSSCLTLVTALFGNLGGKSNTRILKAGSQRGEISATIASDDGSETWEVSRVFLPGKIESPTVRSSVSGKIGSPVAFLQPLVDKISIEPISRAMNASEEEQCEILLKTLPMAISPDDIAKAVNGVDVPGLKAHVQNAAKMASGLDAIAAVHKTIYDYRRDVNRDIKTKETHASELLSSIPESAGAEIDWRTRAGELKMAIESMIADESHHRSECDRVLAEMKHDIVFRKTQKDLEVDDDIDQKIRDLEAQRDARKALIAAEVDLEREGLLSGHKASLEAIEKQYRPDIERLNRDHAVAMQQLESQAGHDRTRKIAEHNTVEAHTLQDKSDAMTKALNQLDALKLILLGRLDSEIKGLRVENGVISLNGVPLSEMNTAERAKFWLRIGAMRAGELGVICADGMECLDENQFKLVVKAMLGTGLQFFLGRVTNSPFSVVAIHAEDKEL